MWTVKQVVRRTVNEFCLFGMVVNFNWVAMYFLPMTVCGGVEPSHAMVAYSGWSPNTY